MSELSERQLSSWRQVHQAPLTLTPSERWAARTALETLQTGGWGYQAACEKVARDLSLSAVVVLREMRELQWPTPAGRGRASKEQFDRVIDWIVESGATAWEDVQDRYGCTRSTARESVAAAKRLVSDRERGVRTSTTAGFLPLAAQWLRSPVYRGSRELREAAADLYRDGRCLMAVRP